MSAAAWDLADVLDRVVQEYEGHADEYDRVADTPERTYDWAKAREQYLADAAALRTLRDRVQSYVTAVHAYENDVAHSGAVLEKPMDRAEHLLTFFIRTGQ